MKQARITLGIILVAGILAVLLSWPERRRATPMDIKENTNNSTNKTIVLCSDDIHPLTTI
ncbi:hypothetical protein HGH93_29670 [Chitinophaga polysaccharea]|uniref:hypothetical protein n=1 Tax=Chitinophaga polysaccharea TaxID=1293035 RepID=UPI0014558C8C|nr:hypothetical protein [Chitinophaga polysaccharea]NLR62297.1 hypothetical protein [Chitinophaga polysaccharea]